MLVANILAFQSVKTDAVEARLRTALAHVAGVHFADDHGTLVVKYRTKIVVVPAETKAVRRMVEKLPEEIPSSTGFKLETYDFDHKRGEPPRPRQAVRTNANWMGDYGTWKMDSRDRQIDGTDKARYYYFAWGSKADPKLIAKVRSALEKGTHELPER